MPLRAVLLRVRLWVRLAAQVLGNQPFAVGSSPSFGASSKAPCFWAFRWIWEQFVAIRQRKCQNSPGLSIREQF